MTDEELRRVLDGFQQRLDHTVARLEETNERRAEDARRFFTISTEAVHGDVRLVAEAVDRLDGKLRVELEKLEERIDRGFSDTQAMIRVERLETSTQ